MEKGNGFNVGDIVVFDLGNPRNEEVIKGINHGRIINEPARVVGYDNEYTTIDKNLHKEAISCTWYSYRFKLAKHLIVQQIIKDL